MCFALEMLTSSKNLFENYVSFPARMYIPFLLCRACLTDFEVFDTASEAYLNKLSRHVLAVEGAGVFLEQREFLFR